ncbi:hypothetical protein JD844_034194 [Phrynosoma platyrhinos]|uniref:Titin-like n=1 Tax=Phrynosoma platyrhinos TaxID=52577 RepID=A0ABQ7T8C0_PHRPL|nr:hypothetical protein JD844_034194 [Phrynosoma platyrhinos]
MYDILRINTSADDDDTIQLGNREADSLSEINLTTQDLGSAIIDLLEQENPLIQHDDETIKLGNREADSLSEAYLTAQDLGSAVIDLLEQENALIQPLTPEVSRSQEDEEPDGGWTTPETETSDPSVVMPRTAVETMLDMAMAEETESATPSIEKIFQNSLISNPELAIEKVLGEATANILTEAEAEASRIADKLEALNDECESETDLTEPHSILTCRVCQLFVRTVDRLLDKSDELKDHYLPLTEEEIGNLKNAVEEMEDVDPDHQMQACLARINNLSSKLRQRAYMMALSKLRLARRNTQENLCQLHQAMDLIGQVQHEDHPQSHHSYRKLSAITIEWTQRRSIVPPLSSVHEDVLHVEEEEIGTPLAQSSLIEEPGIPSIEKVRIPTVEISHVEDEEEVDSYPVTPPEEEETMMPPAEISPAEVTPMPPPEISPEEVIPIPPAEISVTEKSLPPPIQRVPLAKVAMPRDERIQRDVANITITAPGCDEEPMPPLKMQTFEEDEKPMPPLKMQTFEEEGDIPPSEMEAQALEMSRSLACNLQDTYENLLAHLQDLPVDLQQKLYQTCQRMAQLRSDFDSAHNFEDLSRGILSKSFEVMVEAQGSLDELMEYALQSPKALLWLKDHLPVSEEGGKELLLRTESPFPIEEPAVPPGVKTVAEKRNILIIQQTYDPKGCDDEALPGKEKAVTSSPQKRDSEDILKSLQSYEPKGCDDEIPSKKEKEEVSSSSKQEWNILKTLQDYIPKLAENEGFSSDDKEETPPSMNVKEEIREKDILKLQKAHDPKGCDDGVEVVSAPASEWESQDILKVQQAYDPKGCYEGAPPEEEKVAPSSGKQESEDILKIQQAYDPKGCDEGTPPSKQETTPSSKQDWSILKMLQTYVPQSHPDEAPSGKEKKEVVAPSSAKEEVRKGSLSKTQQAHDKTKLIEKEKLQTSSTWEFGNILKIQQMYDPKDCDEGKLSSEEMVAPSSRKCEMEDILKIQQAYDPKGCDDEPPPRREEATPSSKPEWNLLKMFQAYVPKGSTNEAPSGKEEMVPPPPEKQVVKERSILKHHTAYNSQSSNDKDTLVEKEKVQPSSPYDPKGCDEGSPSRKEKEEVMHSSSKVEDILKIQQAYDPRGCDDETPFWKEKKELPPSGKQEEWNIMKFFQSYIPKSRSDEASAVEAKAATSPPAKQEVKEVVPPARQQEVKEWDILKIQKAYDPQGCKDEDN